MQQVQLTHRLVAAEHPLVDRLEQHPGRDPVEGRVVLDVLDGDLDRGLVELLRRDAVEERDRQLGGDLDREAHGVVEALGGSLDGAVDPIGVEGLMRPVAFRDRHLGGRRRLRLGRYGDGGAARLGAVPVEGFLQGAVHGCLLAAVANGPPARGERGTTTVTRGSRQRCPPASSRCPPALPRGRRTTAQGARGALAGLRTRGRAPHALGRSTPTGRRFPDPTAQCSLTAVVPTHRCGAVPDSHRVPSCDDVSG